jgi:hypothetical protein
MFTRRQAVRWAELWLACWNDRDFDTLLALYRDDASFESPSTDAKDGSSPVNRRDALKRYWAAIPFGIHASPAELDRVSFDPETRALTIVYTADLDGTRLRGCDLLTLDEDSRIISGEPCVGSLAANRLEAGNALAAQQATAVSAGGRK